MIYRKSDAQQELEDFTEESRQLERELEASLEQSDNIIRDLQLTNRNLQAELESSRVYKHNYIYVILTYKNTFFIL